MPKGNDVLCNDPEDSRQHSMWMLSKYSSMPLGETPRPSEEEYRRSARERKDRKNNSICICLKKKENLKKKEIISLFYALLAEISASILRNFDSELLLRLKLIL